MVEEQNSYLSGNALIAASSAKKSHREYPRSATFNEQVLKNGGHLKSFNSNRGTGSK